ncbi:MAG TPA: hypothetical protein VLZ05_12735 [Mycobacterium sp.]|nr:hypothetical protein [Mycobacterium sp.]
MLFDLGQAAAHLTDRQTGCGAQLLDYQTTRAGFEERQPDPLGLDVAGDAVRHGSAALQTAAHQDVSPAPMHAAELMVAEARA